MKARKIAIALILVLTGTALHPLGHAAASAATLRTSPFNSFNVERGSARCLVTNGSTVRGTATVKVFNESGALLDSATDTLNPHQTIDGTAAFDFSADHPTYCECTVPSATTWRCSFVYVDTLDGAPSVITNIDGR